MSHRETLKKGQKIYISNDEYIIKRLISRGGTSLIYEAYRPYISGGLGEFSDVENVKRVILKEMAPYDMPFVRKEGNIEFLSDNTDAIEDIFHSEIKNIARIQGSNFSMNRIPEMDAFGKWNGTLYIAMNYIKGDLLSNYIKKYQPNTERVLEIFKDMLYIIKQLHKMKEPYLHLDLKPANFIVGELGSVYLFDFGSSIYHSTEDYSAPEVIFNYYSDIGECSDVYSLGVILYEMLTGDIPELDDFLLSSGRYYSPAPNEPDLNDIIARMTCTLITNRFHSIEEVELALKNKSL